MNGHPGWQGLRTPPAQAGRRGLRERTRAVRLIERSASPVDAFWLARRAGASPMHSARLLYALAACGQIRALGDSGPDHADGGISERFVRR